MIKFVNHRWRSRRDSVRYSINHKNSIHLERKYSNPPSIRNKGSFHDTLKKNIKQ